MNKELNILVVEDKEKHQNAAKQLLTDHKLTVVSTFDSALDYLNGNNYSRSPAIEAQQYDVILTDLLFPQGRGDVQGADSQWLARDEMAFGFPLAIIAATKNIPYVAIVTDMNHHQHPMAYTFDFMKKVKINDTICKMFDDRDLPGVYVLEDGSVTTESPPSQDDDQQSKYKKNTTSDWPKFETAKNWKAALDGLLSDND